MLPKIRKIMPIMLGSSDVRAVQTFASGFFRTRLLNGNPVRGPLFVTWSPTFDCNVYCGFCSTHKLKNRFPETLDLKKTLEIAHQIGRAGVWVTGFTGGEVLMWPHLFEAIKILKSYGVRVYIVTNGLLLKEFASRILDCKLDYVVVSIDSDNATEHDQLRVCDGLFEAALEGISAIKKGRGSHLPIIKTTTVLTKKTMPRMKEILDFLGRRTDITGIQPVVSDYVSGPHNRSDSIMQTLQFSQADRPMVEDVLRLIRSSDPGLNNPYVKGIGKFLFTPDSLKGTIRCWSPFLRLQLLPNGDVFHCTANPRYGSLGNLGTTSLMDIWSSEVMRAQRREIGMHRNNCICWAQDTSFNAFLNAIPLLSRLPIWG